MTVIKTSTVNPQPTARHHSFQSVVLREDWGFQIKILNVLVAKKTVVTKLMILILNQLNFVYVTENLRMYQNK